MCREQQHRSKKREQHGSDIRIIYSVLESLEIAKKNPGKNIIFLGIGFETTAPATAAAIIQAKKDNISNFFVLSHIRSCHLL